MTGESERERLDGALGARGFLAETRTVLWTATDSILKHGPLGESLGAAKTGLALGYVQSGKTTAITALTAAAADDGYRVIVALLGSTNLLLDQNADRLIEALGLRERADYRWVTMTNPSKGKAKEIAGYLERGRVLLLMVLKHAGRIRALAEALERAGCDSLPTLIIDDEADQASLNTKVAQAEQSKTYDAINSLRGAAPKHLYVQFTATPYAPLLLEPEDSLKPDFVELLHPGPGYTGGREFFVDHADIVVRSIPTLDEQAPRSLPQQLPRSLVTALGSFVAGTALLLGNDSGATPVSMLVHSTQRNDVQARYHFLLGRTVKTWKAEAEAAETLDELPADIVSERQRMVAAGATELSDDLFMRHVRYVLGEATLWLVNSASDVARVDWRVAPVHILVGGNKLDRGFTVEGLTVTYMNRPPSPQVDTLEQRARAFGYRGDLLPYCQFFATPRTLKVLREIVDTEYDLRANLRDWLEAGKNVADWATHVGLLLPEGTKPTRENVIMNLSHFNDRAGWHQLRRPAMGGELAQANAEAVAECGLLSAPLVDYGRLAHPTLRLPIDEVVKILQRWSGVDIGVSPGWRHAELLDLLSRLPSSTTVPMLLMRHPDGGSRERTWDAELGFINLMQGADPGTGAGPRYPGDREIGGVNEDPEQVVVQVHLVRPKGSPERSAVYTLAVHAGRRKIVRRD